MSAGIAATLAAAVLIGVALGGLGGGGSIVTVPTLVYLAGIDIKSAIAMSLVVVGVTAAVALVPHARAGNVRWRTGLVFGGAGMAGAYAGGRIGALIPGPVLLGFFATMMLATAVAMLRPRPEHKAPGAPRPLWRVLAEGVGVGLVTGMVGAGGGFLVVPALVLLGGLPMTAAVGTSLVVIAMKSGAAFAGYLHATAVDWSLTAAVTALAVIGSLVGARLAARAEPAALRRVFGWFVIVLGLGMVAGQIVA